MLATAVSGMRSFVNEFMMFYEWSFIVLKEGKVVAMGSLVDLLPDRTLRIDET